MTIALHIPLWLLWAIGVPLVLLVLAFAVIGWGFCRSWSNHSGNI